MITISARTLLTASAWVTACLLACGQLAAAGDMALTTSPGAAPRAAVPAPAGAPAPSPAATASTAPAHTVPAHRASAVMDDLAMGIPVPPPSAPLVATCPAEGRS